jgi:hypothetical protein
VSAIPRLRRIAGKIVGVKKSDSFFADLQQSFREKFGREMTAEERKFFALAEHAVRNEQQKRGDDEDAA